MLLAVIYLGAMSFTESHFMADTGGYVVSVLAYNGEIECLAENPTVRDYRSQNAFWDFGHLFWRPLGLVLYKIFAPATRFLVGPDEKLNVLVAFILLNVIAGLLTWICMFSLIDRLTGRAWVAMLATTALIFSHGFLNFSKTGASYITGLAFLTLGLYLLLRNRGSLGHRTAILAGAAFAAAVTMWFLYVLVVPAAIIAPLILFGLSKDRNRLILLTAGSFLLTTAVSYSAVMTVAGIRNIEDMRAWVKASSHGVTTGGATRMVFGLPRSFVNMGDDGIVFKRFLLRDSFNPVFVSDLIRLTLWKLVIFYLALLSIVLLLYISAKRVLILLMLFAIPVGIFATVFDGGAVERYLPFYPLLFLSLGSALAIGRVPHLLKAVVLLFFGIASVTDVAAVAKPVPHRQQEQAASRLELLLRYLQPNSWIITTHLQDELVGFQANYPFHSLNRNTKYHIYPLVVPNSAQSLQWRQLFASRTLKTWSEGGDVWASMRLFSSRPRAEWSWAEGDDPAVSWKDLKTFCDQLQIGVNVGGADGFVPVLKTAQNERLLRCVSGEIPGSRSCDEIMDTR
jgi:hypothetical protein